MKKLLLPFLVVQTACAVAAWAQPAPYSKALGVQGVLRIVGSDGHQDIGRLWAEKFHAIYPAVVVQVEGGGSQAAPSAVKEGRADFGLMARELNAAEKTEFADLLTKSAFVQVATDTLAIFVAKENPLPGLNLSQLERLFGANPRNGQPIKTWADLGVQSLGTKPVLVAGRTAGTGVHSLLKNLLLGGGAFRSDIVEHVGPSSVIRAVAGDPAVIGYAQIRQRTAKVRAVPLSTQGDQLIEPTLASSQAGTYPLLNNLYLLVGVSAEPAVHSLRVEFVRYVLSREGQEAAEAAGLVPLRPAAVAPELAKLK